MSLKRHQENEAKFKGFSLDEKLATLDSTDLHKLVQNIMERNSEVHRLILEWFKERAKGLKHINEKKDLASLNDELLMGYWENAREIISEFNEYGGGPEDDEEDAYDWLDQISELIKEGNISTDAKFEFLDDAFEEYDIGNSGFEDGLMEAFFEICETKKEWKFLVEKLGEHPTDWKKKLIMRIQKKYLQDDDAYLKMRKEDLHYGMDYWDLAEFYIQKEDTKKAVEIAEHGLLKGDGRLTELFEFLSDYYAKSRDTADLERVVQYALKKKSDEKVMLDRLFEYYNAENDYENAKRALLKAFEYVKPAGYIAEVRSYAHYNKMKQFLTDSDWKNIEPRIIREAREKDLEDYLRICLDKDLKKEVVHILLNPPKKQSGFRFGFDTDYNFDEFANQLKEEFSEDIIKYYWQKACRNISNGNRGTYRTAAGYLGMVKHIYIDLLIDEPLWEQRFSGLKATFKNRPAFLDEVSRIIK